MVFRKSILPQIVSLTAILISFIAVFHTISRDGLKTRLEKNYYLDYQLTQEEKVKQKQNRVLFPIQNKDIQNQSYNHLIEIYCNIDSRFDKISEITFEISSPSDCEIESAELIFPKNHLLKGDVAFSSSESKILNPEGKLTLTRNDANFDDDEHIPEGTIKGFLKIRTVGDNDLSIWLQKSERLHQTTMLWINIPGETGDFPHKTYGNLSGYVKLQQENVPSYSKAQLLAFTWGFGVNGQYIIYILTGLAMFLWILGTILLHQTPETFRYLTAFNVINSLGVTCIFLGSCVIFSCFFPPFRGPDEVHHFTGFAQATGKPHLLTNSVHLSNLGSFYRVHRNQNEKMSSLDTIFQNHFDWPTDVTNPYHPTRSPLGMAIWKCIGHFLNFSHAGYSMLALRILNGLFVSACLFLSLCLLREAFPDSKLSILTVISLVWFPCIAHFSTVVSNYPFLIGAYTVQIVILGSIWAILGKKYLSKFQLGMLGSVLGVGLAIGISSADNAIATLPFWCVIISSFFAARALAEQPRYQCAKECMYLMLSCIFSCTILALLVGLVSLNQSFLPSKAADALSNMLPFNLKPIQAGFFLLVVFFIGVGGLTFILFHSLRFLNSSITIVKVVRAGKWVFLLSAMAFLVFSFRVPEINLSRGGGANIISYPFSVLFAFADGFLPGSVDSKVTGSFWRRLGWHDTNLPWALMEFLRLSMGVGLALMIWKILRDDFNPKERFFGILNIFSLVFCVFTIGALYFSVLYNVNSRYILICYMLGSVMSVEGYRQALLQYQLNTFHYHILLNGFVLIAILLQSMSWTSVLNRFF